MKRIHRGLDLWNKSVEKFGLIVNVKVAVNRCSVIRLTLGPGWPGKPFSPFCPSLPSTPGLPADP